MEKMKNKDHIAYLLQELAKYKTLIIALVVSTSMLGGGYYFYSSYRDSIETSAHADFIEYMQYFDAKVEDGETKNIAIYEDVESFDSEQSKWTKVSELFREGYEKHRSSGMAPMFLAFESEALINLDKLDEAIKSLEVALASDFSPELKQLYLVKLALMKIDSDDEVMQHDGFELLKAMSDEKNFAKNVNALSVINKIKVSGNKNYVHDLSLYRLGEYYWLKKDYKEASNYWNQLVLQYGKDSSDPSSWAKLASEKLKLISAQ